MDKPHWANEVKEVTREEAYLLRSLGVRVHTDYGPLWDVAPFNSVSHERLDYVYTGGFHYIEKDTEQ